MYRFNRNYIKQRPLEELVLNPFKLSSRAATFELINRPDTRLIIPGSRTKSSVSSFILFENEQALLEELPSYGNSFIVDKYSNVFYEVLDYLVKEASFLHSLADITKVSLDYPEAYIALAIQKPYGLQALASGLQASYKVETTEIPDKEVLVDYIKLGAKSFSFLFKCETTRMLSHTVEEGEKVFSLENVLESCAYQLMYVTKECALGCAFCQKGVGYDNT